MKDPKKQWWDVSDTLYLCSSGRCGREHYLWQLSTLKYILACVEKATYVATIWRCCKYDQPGTQCSSWVGVFLLYISDLCMHHLCLFTRTVVFPTVCEKFWTFNVRFVVYKYQAPIPLMFSGEWDDGFIGLIVVFNTLRSRQLAAIFQTTFSNAFSWMKKY